MQPVLLVSHDDPGQVLDQVLDRAHPGHRFLKALAPQLVRPQAIVCVSAHWEMPCATVSGAPILETIHDCYGFPEHYYQLPYRVPGAPDLARQIHALLSECHIDAAIDNERGIDHGAWCVLKPLFPEADIPTLQLSVCPGLSAEQHFQFGKALQPLREQDILILASGTMTHNLSEWHPDATYDMPAEPYARAFRDWVVMRRSAKTSCTFCHCLLPLAPWQTTTTGRYWKILIFMVVSQWPVLCGTHDKHPVLKTTFLPKVSPESIVSE